MIGVLDAFLWTSAGEGPNKLVISTVAVGLISLIIGELGGYPTLHFLFTSIYCRNHFFYIKNFNTCFIILFKGRRRSRVGLLKVYMVASCIALYLSVLSVAKSNLTLEVR